MLQNCWRMEKYNLSFVEFKLANWIAFLALWLSTDYQFEMIKLLDANDVNSIAKIYTNIYRNRMFIQANSMHCIKRMYTMRPSNRNISNKYVNLCSIQFNFLAVSFHFDLLFHFHSTSGNVYVCVFGFLSFLNGI